MKQELTKAETRCLRAIKDFMLENGYCPSVKDLMKALHYSSTSTIANLLSGLEAKGEIERPVDGGSRAMKVRGMQYREAEGE